MLLTYKTILSKKSQLNSTTYLYHFDLLEPKEIKFSAGQYLMIKIPTDKGMVSRLYSIASSSSEKNSFELIVQIIPGGLASNYLSNFKVKDEIIFQGLSGMFGLKENNRPKIFLATGTGIAPVRSILISNIKDQISKIQIKNQKYYLFWGLKNYKDVYLFDELKKLVTTVIPAEAGIHLKICLSREQNLDMIPENDKKYFELGHIDQCLEKQLTNFDFYLCGRREIVESLRQFLIKKGVLPENIHFEKF
jgi:NAD(P)H-flavin reductase